MPRLILKIIQHVFTVLIITVFSTAFAQPSGSMGNDFLYKVVKNDNLINLSTKYTQNANNWVSLQQLNNVQDPYALPIGMVLRIPLSLIPMQDATATIKHVQGQAYINSSSASVNMQVKEGDIIRTADNSFASISLPDNSVTSIPNNSILTITRLRTFKGTELLDFVATLNEGGIESVVDPDAHGTGRFEIRTPVSITGVRGTKLRVRTDNNQSHSEVIEGSAQVGLSQADGPRISSNQGTTASREGGIMPVVSLPDAPQIPRNQTLRNGSQLYFDPVHDAIAYQVIIASDRDGKNVVSNTTIDNPPARLSANGPGKWYAFVRSIDSNGFISADSVVEFDGVAVLTTSDQTAVKDSSGNPILLSH